MKLGKHAPRFDTRTLLFGKYLTKTLPPPPHSVDYSKRVKSWPMMANDNYGDCTCAAAVHMIQQWTAYTSSEVVLKDKDILTAYRVFAGNDPDAGANMLEVLNYWRKSGIGGDKISAFAQLEPKNATQAKDAINLFGNCYIGVSLPNCVVKNVPDLLAPPWIVQPQGPVGNAAPNPRNGHCIPAVAYDDRNLYVVTWGALKAMSWQFYQAYMDEAYAILSIDWAKKKKTAPSGFDFATLKKDLSIIEDSN